MIHHYKKDEKPINPNKSSLEEFLSGVTTFAEEYPHLQIFLHRQRKNDLIQDYEFLMVTPSSFGKVIVQDLYFEYPYIIVEFYNCALKKTGNVRININEVNPRVLFICWQDVKHMAQIDRNDHFNDSELLEFDY